MISLEQIADALYTTYCQAVGGKAFNGDPLPDWQTFRRDPAKQVQSEAWIKVAQESIAQAAARMTKSEVVMIDVKGKSPEEIGAAIEDWKKKLTGSGSGSNLPTPGCSSE
jgi:hypothetical protein